MSCNSEKKTDFIAYLSVEAIHHSYLSLHFEFSKIDARTVKNKWKKLKTHKATGGDTISNKLLKTVAVSLAPSLTNRFKSLLTPVFKVGSGRARGESGPQVLKRRTFEKVFFSYVKFS